MKITFSEQDVINLLTKANLKLRRARIVEKNSQVSLAFVLAEALNEEMIARSEGRE